MTAGTVCADYQDKPGKHGPNNERGAAAEAKKIQTEALPIELAAAIAGPADGPLAILLHGFPDFSYGWRRQIPALAAAGLRVAAPDQRGYNRSAKPAGIAAYGLDTLADDVLGLADALGAERFAVVGHDWGGVVAWHLAAEIRSG